MKTISVGHKGLALLSLFAAVWLTAPVTVAPALGQATMPAVYSGTSAGGLYAVTLAPSSEPIKINVIDSWTLTVTTAAGAPVTDATITIGGGMPAHGHGLPTAPQVTQNLGEGKYLIEGVRFNMVGEWVLDIGVTAPAGTDTATVTVPL